MKSGPSFVAVLVAPLLLATVPFALVAACATGRVEPVGVTTAYGDRVEPTPSAAVVRAPTWPHASAVAEWPRANARSFVSQGHLFGRWVADVHVSPAASSAYANVGPGSALPVGAVVAEILRGKDDARGPIFAMEKSEAGWRYLEVAADGTVLRDGRGAPCVDCHAHVASQDELFGIPTTGREGP